ncbi:MAG: ribonuclease D [Pseudomonadota bacterium]
MPLKRKALNSMKVITDTDALQTFCAGAATAPFIAIDTEFMREKTYWPILCLVQVAYEGDEAIIDPFADGLDLTPLLTLLDNQQVVKVFHAARQDVEIFVRLLGHPPTPLFDTQIAAMVCGFGDQIGYEPLMKALVGASIDKGSRFTDWSRRPLSEQQLTYALSDVTYLRQAFPILEKKLGRDGRADWVTDEMKALTAPALYESDPKLAWTRLKLRGVKTHEMGPLIKLAEWREREAQNRDVPRGRVAKDDTLFELARMKPTKAADLSRARTLSKGIERSRFADDIIAAVAEGTKIAADELPKIKRKPDKPPAPPEVLELLKVVLKRQCEKHHVAPRLIASTSDLEDLALYPDRESKIMSGWRGEIFGDVARRVMNGDTGLRLNNGEIDLIDLT